jgi:hypothetical protein
LISSLLYSFPHGFGGKDGSTAQMKFKDGAPGCDGSKAMLEFPIMRGGSKSLLKLRGVSVYLCPWIVRMIAKD